MEANTNLIETLKRPPVLWAIGVVGVLIVATLITLTTDVGFATVQSLDEEEKVDPGEKLVATIWTADSICDNEILEDRIEDAGLQCNRTIWEDDAVCQVEGLWEEDDIWTCERIRNTPKIVPTFEQNAINIVLLLNNLEEDWDATAEQYGNKEPGPFKPTNFMVKGEGLILAVSMEFEEGGSGDEDDTQRRLPEAIHIMIDLEPHDGEPDAMLQIGTVIEGSAVRDATGFLAFKDFDTQLEHGAVNKQLQAIIRRDVNMEFIEANTSPNASPEVAVVELQDLQGKGVSFVGAIALQDESSLDEPFVITPVEIETINLEAYDFAPDDYVDSVWDRPQVLPTFEENAKDINTVLSMLADDPARAFRTFGEPNRDGDAYGFMVQGQGEVIGVHSQDATSTIDVKLQDSDTVVSVQVGPEIEGTAIRDAVGFLTYDVFDDNRKFREVATALNNQVEDDITSKLYPPALYGKLVSFTGAFMLEGTPDDFAADQLDSILITPVMFNEEAGLFNASNYVDYIWDSQLVPTFMQNAVELDTLLTELQDDRQAAIEQYGHLGENDSYSFMVKGSGQVLEVDTTRGNGFLRVDLDPVDGEPDVRVLIGPAFESTAIRDAVGFLPPSPNIEPRDYGSLSARLNLYVRNNVIQQSDAQALTAKYDNQNVTFYGAFTLNQSGEIAIMPVQLEVEGS